MNNDEWLIEGIKTKAGKELVIYMNKHFGSSVWGKVIEGVKDIEKELGDG
jgi:vacuolar-type H+-ATPase subunit E/Vma4